MCVAAHTQYRDSAVKDQQHLQMAPLGWGASSLYGPSMRELTEPDPELLFDHFKDELALGLLTRGREAEIVRLEGAWGLVTDKSLQIVHVHTCERLMPKGWCHNSWAKGD